MCRRLGLTPLRAPSRFPLQSNVNQFQALPSSFSPRRTTGDHEQTAQSLACYPDHMREFLNDWWRLLKLIVGSLAIPVILWGLLVWIGVLK
ncbi:hypothetical protein GCM10008949_21660 [Deinococcus humi]|nr:hypothetical protein GCM10008949_21660 [Deinococcus humi]